MSSKTHFSIKGVLTMQDLQWQERYAWYYYWREQIENYTESDFERDADGFLLRYCRWNLKT